LHIEDPDVLEKILFYLDVKGDEPKATGWPPSRAPPQQVLIE
jgi:hypothetical protein